MVGGQFFARCLSRVRVMVRESAQGVRDDAQRGLAPGELPGEGKAQALSIHRLTGGGRLAVILLS